VTLDGRCVLLYTVIIKRILSYYLTLVVPEYESKQRNIRMDR